MQEPIEFLFSSLPCNCCTATCEVACTRVAHLRAANLGCGMSALGLDQTELQIHILQKLAPMPADARENYQRTWLHSIKYLSTCQPLHTWEHCDS